MKKFIVLYHARAELMKESANTTPEEQAKDIEEAKKLLIGHPHLSWNAACSIEVHETMPLPGM